MACSWIETGTQPGSPYGVQVRSLYEYCTPSSRSLRPLSPLSSYTKPASSPSPSQALSNHLHCYAIARAKKFGHTQRLEPHYAFLTIHPRQHIVCTMAGRLLLLGLLENVCAPSALYMCKSAFAPKIIREPVILAQQECHILCENSTSPVFNSTFFKY